MLLAIALLLAALTCRGDYIAARWVEPSRQEWADGHWEWYGERYWVIVHISSTGQERYELWEITAREYFGVTEAMWTRIEDATSQRQSC